MVLNGNLNDKTRGEIENNRHSADRNINSNKNNFKDQSKSDDHKDEPDDSDEKSNDDYDIHKML